MGALGVGNLFSAFLYCGDLDFPTHISTTSENGGEVFDPMLFLPATKKHNAKDNVFFVCSLGDFTPCWQTLIHAESIQINSNNLYIVDGKKSPNTSGT